MINSAHLLDFRYIKRHESHRFRRFVVFFS